MRIEIYVRRGSRYTTRLCGFVPSASIPLASPDVERSMSLKII